MVPYESNRAQSLNDIEFIFITFLIINWQSQNPEQSIPGITVRFNFKIPLERFRVSAKTLCFCDKITPSVPKYLPKQNRNNETNSFYS